MQLENREQMPGDAAGMISDLTRCTLQDRRVACPQQMQLAEDRAHGDMQRARTAVGNLDRDTELSATDTECLRASPETICGCAVMAANNDASAASYSVRCACVASRAYICANFARGNA